MFYIYLICSLFYAFVVLHVALIDYLSHRYFVCEPDNAVIHVEDKINNRQYGYVTNNFVFFRSVAAGFYYTDADKEITGFQVENKTIHLPRKGYKFQRDKWHLTRIDIQLNGRGYFAIFIFIFAWVHFVLWWRWHKNAIVVKPPKTPDC